jgi:hypothetical protein
MVVHLILFSISDLSAMYRMSGRHTGKHLAHVLEALLKTFGIEKKACFILSLLFRLETY